MPLGKLLMTRHCLPAEAEVGYEDDDCEGVYSLIDDMSEAK